MLRLILALVVVLGVLQIPLLLLARWLGRPLRLEAVLAGWALPFVLLGPWLPGKRLLVPCDAFAQLVPGIEKSWKAHAEHLVLNDLLYQLLPWELEVRHALAARTLPFWSDRLEGGSSPWSNPQAQVLSPVAFGARLAPIQHHLLVSLALKMLVALQGAWVLARTAGASRSGALLAGASLALGGGVIAWGLFPLSTAVAWAPWVVAGVVAIARGARVRAVVALALATAAMLLAGHPEAALASALLAGVLGGALRRRARTKSSPAATRRAVPWTRFFARALAGGVLGVALAAPMLLPFLAVAQRSQRAAERIGRVSHVRLPPARGARWFVGDSHRFFAGTLTPVAYHTRRPYHGRFEGPWDWPTALAAYSGLVAAAGGAASIAGRLRRRRALALMLAFVAWGIVASRFTPLEWLLQRLPLLRVPEPTRFLPVAAVALTAAAALGWDALRRSRAIAPRVAVALLLVVALALRPALLDVRLVLLAAGVLAAALTMRARPRIGLALLAACLLADLVPWSRAQLPADEPALFYPRTRYVEALERQVGEGGPWRVAGEDYTLYPSILPAFGFDEVRPHNPLAPAPYLAVLHAAFGFSPTAARYFSPFSNVEHPLADFLGVRALATNVYQPPKRRFEQVNLEPWTRRGKLRWSRLGDHGDLGPAAMFRNPAALPRWFLPRDVAVVPRRALVPWVRSMTDARTVALFADEAGAWRPPPRPWEPAAVRAASARPGRIALAVGGEGERLLATSLPGPFGWHATASGKALPLLTVDGAFLGVRLPAGTHDVELRYLPPGLGAGLGLAGIAGAACVGLLLYPRVRQRRSRTAQVA